MELETSILKVFLILFFGIVQYRNHLHTTTKDLN